MSSGAATFPPDGPYDVIIVGGRPAGASLAMRLGRLGMRVLILERAKFPSAPPVSVPFLMNNAMRVLDELGLDEAEYAGDAPRLRRFFVEYKDYFRASISITDVAGRDYVYVIDRARFDTCLWNHLARFDTVTRVEDARVTDVLRDGAGRICGVEVQHGEGAPRRVTADAVIGADGRYSLIARKAGARVTEQRTDLDTSALYAYWTGFEPYDAEPAAVQIHASGDGFSLIVMPTDGGRASVVFQGRSDRFQPQPGKVEEYYREGLRRHPLVWRRLANATQVSPIRGIKHIDNLYRQAGGPGWALVGDAFHQKDFIDAQGIYDALLGAQLLAAALGDWKRGALPWEQAVARYEREATEATRPMFMATLDRVKREIYSEMPAWAAKTALRWMMTDREYQRRFSLLVSRQIDPAAWAPPRVLLGALARGAAADVRRLAGR